VARKYSPGLESAFYALWCAGVQDGQEQLIEGSDAHILFGPLSPAVKRLVREGSLVLALLQVARERLLSARFTAGTLRRAAKAWVDDFFPYESDDPDDRADVRELRETALTVIEDGLASL
jgi:hypothetical protein